MISELQGEIFKNRFKNIKSFTEYFACQVIKGNSCAGLSCDGCTEYIEKIIKNRNFDDVVFSLMIYESSGKKYPFTAYMEANNIPFRKSPLRAEVK